MKYSILTIALLLISGITWAQGTIEDYNRAYGLREKFSSKLIFYSDVTPQWVEGTDCFWYVRNTPEGAEYVKVDAGEKKRTPLFDQKRLSVALTASTGKTINPMQLPIRGCQLSQGLDTLRFVYEGKRWCFDIIRPMRVCFLSLPNKSIGWNGMTRKKALLSLRPMASMWHLSKMTMFVCVMWQQAKRNN